MEAGKRNITDIFNRARTLELPFFQRTYVWSEDNWERFLEDMQATASTRRPYFLGSVIQKQRSTSSGESMGDVRTVVDGQQRLTTLALFFKSLTAAHDQRELFDGTFRGFTKKLILQHNHADIKAFEAVLNDQVTAEVRKKNPTSQILAAHDYFEARRDELKGIDPLALLQLVYFVGIDLGPEEDEQQIFDTINSLGVALTTAELLKNELFGRSDLDLYNGTWREVFEADSASRAYWGRLVTAGRSRREMHDLFLQSFLAMQSGPGDEFRVDHLFEDYKRFLHAGGTDRASIARELARTAQLYRENVRVELLDEAPDPTSPIERLNVLLFGLNTTTVLPYVLFVLRSVANPIERDRVLGLVETFIVRRLICRETSKNYNKLFTSLVRNQTTTFDALASRIAHVDDANASMPTDDAFTHAFQQVHLTNQQARVLLYLLELSIRDDARHSTALSGLNHYSLEHLMPKKWHNHWGAMPADKARERDQTLLKLGNLSLLSSSLNSAIRDAPWQKKKSGVGARHGLSHYAAGLETLGEYLKLDTWDEAAIQTRGSWLAQQALRVWPSPSVLG